MQNNTKTKILMDSLLLVAISLFSASCNLNNGSRLKKKCKFNTFKKKTKIKKKVKNTSNTNKCGTYKFQQTKNINLLSRSMLKKRKLWTKIKKKVKNFSNPSKYDTDKFRQTERFEALDELKIKKKTLGGKIKKQTKNHKTNTVTKNKNIKVNHKLRNRFIKIYSLFSIIAFILSCSLLWKDNKGFEALVPVLMMLCILYFFPVVYFITWGLYIGALLSLLAFPFLVIGSLFLLFNCSPIQNLLHYIGIIISKVISMSSKFL